MTGPVGLEIEYQQQHQYHCSCQQQREKRQPRVASQCDAVPRKGSLAIGKMCPSVGVRERNSG